jgi:hypothetical protein
MRRLTLILAVLALAVGASNIAGPAIAHASWAGPCPAPAGSPSYWVNACEQEERDAAAKAHAEANPPCSVFEWSVEPEHCTTEAAKAAAEAAKAAAKKAEEQAPATLLRLAVRSYHGSSYSGPGQTDIAISTTPYARVTVTGDHGVKTFRFQQLVEGQIEDEESLSGPGPAPGPAINTIYWSCHLRGQTIHYTVKAQGSTGPPLVRTGAFKITLSARWCATAKRREDRQTRRDTRERQKTEAEERKEAAAKHQHEVERYETNCRAIGGTPVEISTSEGNRIVCHSKTGGVIPVPQ